MYCGDTYAAAAAIDALLPLQRKALADSLTGASRSAWWWGFRRRQSHVLTRVREIP